MSGNLLVGFHVKRKNLPSSPYAVAQALFERALETHWREIDPALSTLTVSVDPYVPASGLASRPPRGEAGTTTINLPVVREMLLGLTTFFATVRWAAGSSPRVVTVCFHYPPVSAIILGLCRITKSKAVVIFTDLPLFSYGKDHVAKMPSWKRILAASYKRLSDALAVQYDGYVLFSKAMGEVVNPKGRPSIVVEGMLNTERISDATVPREEWVIAHAGTLDREYGIETILDAFSCIQDDRARLWLVGSGDMDGEINRRATMDSRITHFGFCPREEVVQLLQRAALLVILRDPKKEYTKYSFPSKIFEYMLSGTPTATTALEGIPEEYFEYLLKIEHGAPEFVAWQIVGLLSMDSETLRDRGEAGRRYVIEHKSASAQSRRIATFAEEIAADPPSARSMS